MTYEFVRENLMGGTPVVRRCCRICEGQIVYTTRQAQPVLESCACRPTRRRVCLPMSWTELRQLVESGRIERNC